MRLPFIKKFDKHSTSSMIIYLGSSQMISNVVRIISGILVARFVLPQMLGTFNGMGIIIGYLPILQLGVMNGLNRELPYCFGKGEIDKAKRYASVAQFWEVALSSLAFTVLTLISFYYLFQAQYLFAAGFFAYGLSAIYHYYGQNYLQILFRTNHDFNKLSNISLIIAFFSLITVVLVWKWQFYGLCLRSIILIAVEMYFLWKWKPLYVLPTWDFQVMKEIVIIGMPIFIVGIVFALWTTLQNTLVLKMGGAEQFGFFALAVMIENSMAIVEHSVAQVIYPKMAYEYGSGKGVNDLMKISFKPILYVFIFLIPSVLIAWYILPFAIELLLPKYMSGIEAARWTMLLLLIAIWGVNNNIFNVVKKQKDFLISIIAGMVVFIVALLGLYHLKGFSLVIFPQAMLIGKGFQVLIAYLFILNYRRNPGLIKV
jgi:O-antigen/teichoic acid export membrane protein